MIIGLSVGVIYSVINAFFVCKLDDIEMINSITLGLPVYTFYMAIGNMLGVGGGNYVTRLIAKKYIKSIQKVISFVMLASVLIGVISYTSILIIDEIVNLLGATIDNFYFMKVHIIGLTLMSPFLILNFSLEQIVRSEGASRASLNGIIISVVINFVLDPLLILYLDLNVLGEAIALGMGCLGASVYYLSYIVKRSENLKLKKIKTDLNVAKVVVTNGISELFLAGYLVFASVLINHLAVSYGSDVLAGFGIALRIIQVPEFVIMGLVLGMTPVIAYNYSNGNTKRMKRAIKFMVTYIALFSIPFALIVMIESTNILHLFSTSVEFVETSKYILIVMTISSLFTGYTTLIMNTFQACGFAKESGTLGASQGLILFPVVIILNNIIGVKGLLWSLTVTEIATFTFAIILYIKKFKYKKENYV